MEYENILLFWINKVSFQSRKELSARFAAAGEVIAAEEWACLLILWQNGPLSPGKIAESTVRDRTTATRLIDRLEKKDLVRRIPHEADRRRVIVEVTERGERLRDVLVPIAGDFISEVVGGVAPDKLATALETVKIISERLDDLATKSD